VNLVVDPNRAGPNAIHLYILDATGRTVNVPNGVTLQMTLPAKQLGPFRETPFLAGPGHYQLNTSDLSFPGTWTVLVSAQFSKFDESTASFDVNVNP
jgi:copper transport protein